MWTFDNAPLAKINKAYGTRIDKAWLDHVQAAAVRLNVGCSGAVVSPQGLVLTNQHCVMDCAQGLSSSDKDYVADGFAAEEKDDEKVCPGMAADILLSIEDYSQQVKAAGKGLTGDAFMRAQNARSSEIENTVCGKDKALHCQMISLYEGGQFKLYKYRRYSDIRLVFAPEFQAAFFGGDPDNFNFPRYALDIGFLRLYENGRPVTTPQFLKWNSAAPKAGMPTFVAGNPGWTERQMTVSQLETERDIYMPPMQLIQSELRGRLISFSEQSAENKRIATKPLFELENSFKGGYGAELALRNPDILVAKQKEEAFLKGSLKGKFKKDIGDPWADIATAQQRFAAVLLPYYFLEPAPNSSQLFAMARKLIRAAEEREKPSSQRLPEYADSRLALLKRDLMAPVPVEKPLETLYLEFRLSKAREYLGNDAGQTRILLGQDSPESLAEKLVSGTELDDPDVRKALWDGGLAAIKASDDPMIQYALRIDDAARAVRHQYEDQVAAPVRIASEKIARVKFEALGTSTYPDATFSLRLSSGMIAGWSWRGETVAPFTYMKGLYDRATDFAPYTLSEHFADARDQFDGDTVFDFTSTNDIAGGSSGSPVINAKGEIVGTVFDGNIHSLGGGYVYDGTLNRTISVSAAAISVALDKVYDAQGLLRELDGR